MLAALARRLFAKFVASLDDRRMPQPLFRVAQRKIALREREFDAVFAKTRRRKAAQAVRVKGGQCYLDSLVLAPTRYTDRVCYRRYEPNRLRRFL